MKRRNLLILLLAATCHYGIAQSHFIDSLHNALKTEKDDTNKINTLNLLSEKLWRRGQYDTAITCANQSLALAKNLKFKKGMAGAYHSLGVIYRNKGSYPQALQYDLTALELCQQIGDKTGIGINLGNIGIIYMNQGNFRQALNYDFKALAICRELGDKTGISRNLGNIGIIYADSGKYSESLNYALNSLQIHQEIGDNQGVAYNLNSIGTLYFKERKYSNSLEYYFKGLSVAKKIGNSSTMANDFGNIGSIYVLQRKNREGKAYLDSGLNLAKSLGEKIDIKDIYASLAALDSISGDYKTAFKDYETYIIYRDSITNDANTKKIEEAQINYAFDRKTDSAKAAQNKLDIIAAKESQHQKMLLNSFIGGFILMILLAFFIFRGYRQKQRANIIITQQKEEVEKQKDLIEKQKTIVEEKNKDILDSIMYAKRLQDAILPPVSLIAHYLPESFVLYKPKDIVAGDFYWMERMGDTILIAAADCTGHGVPGALVSVICSNALNRTVKEFHITEPGKILDKVRELVLETFEKSESNVQDGMDISLCCINTKTKEIQWSGAYNSLWYIQNGEIHEIEADKQPIGKNDKPIPFNTRHLKLQKGGTFYLFTDGYADQFGGPKGKKFKYKPFQETLSNIATLEMDEQKQKLNEIFEAWRGNMEQTDDVCIIGIRV